MAEKSTNKWHHDLIDKDKLASLPSKTGVYLMKDSRGKVIYVGKAINLKNRVRSYFNEGHKTVKEMAMVPHIKSVDTIVTDSEVEALILENNLIKKYRPKYNVNLKDDKSYPYLKVTTEETFPRLIISRQLSKQGRYFGPYPNAGAARETIRLLRKLFPVRTCKGTKPKNRHNRPCLNYYINRCLAPCSEKVSSESYREMIDKIIAVLEGKEGGLLSELQKQMDQAASAMDFERAAEYRDQKQALEKIREKQKIVSDRREDHDIIAIHAEGDRGCAQIYYIRGGKLMGRNNFIMATGKGDQTDILTSFLKQYYDSAQVIPKEILVSHPIKDQPVIEEWLYHKRGGKVQIKVPQRGDKYQLMNMAMTNARLELENDTLAELNQEKQRKLIEGALKELALKLGLSELPYRIEGYDISHTQGQGTVGSMVVFEGGEPVNREYRKFKIRTVHQPDDYQAMAEMLERRLLRAQKEQKDRQQDDSVDLKFAVLPDLIVIDGGKGQLSRALQVLKETGFDHIPMIALAKREEEIYVPNQGEPLRLPAHSEALKLIQRLRDEAHRFAVTYHRTTRTKTGFHSLLDEIPEIGPRRKQELFNAFESLEAMKEASIEELCRLPSMNQKAAQNLLSHLKSVEELVAEDPEDYRI